MPISKLTEILIESNQVRTNTECRIGPDVGGGSEIVLGLNKIGSVLTELVTTADI